jgi:hypothetical protein
MICVMSWHSTCPTASSVLTSFIFCSSLYMDYGIKIPAVTAAGILPKPFYILP